MPVCYAPRYEVTLRDEEHHEHISWYVPYLRDIPALHEAFAHLTKGVIDNLVQRPVYRDGAIRYEQRASKRCAQRYSWISVKLLTSDVKAFSTITQDSAVA